MNRRYLLLIVAVYLVFPVKLVAANSVSMPGDEGITGHLHILAQGEELDCYAKKAGSDVYTIARYNRFLKPTELYGNTPVTLPETRYNLHTVLNKTSLIEEAVRLGIPEFQLRILNRLPLYRGRSLIIPIVEDGPSVAQTCLPYPLNDVSLAAESVIRGTTLFVFVDTSAPALVDSVFVNQTEPCYSLDPTYYVCLVGISALASPGFYDAQLHLKTANDQTQYNFRFYVQEGTYGFQYIDPPAALYRLLTGDIMALEEAFLQPYRAIRTSQRFWSLPLTYPLMLQLPISADYGDRRSYGGMLDGYHSGVDYSAWSGLPVLAPAAGTVIFSDYLQVRGNAILIDHGWGLVSGFWHLSSSNVSLGQHVEKGDIIGNVGNTGLSTGAHLHWETWVNGISVDGKQLISSVHSDDGMTAFFLP